MEGQASLIARPCKRTPPDMHPRPLTPQLLLHPRDFARRWRKRPSRMDVNGNGLSFSMRTERNVGMESAPGALFVNVVVGLLGGRRA